MSREAHVRFCESPGVKLPGATRQHRLFSYITQNWRGRPLTSHEVVLNLIANTTTKNGLRVRAGLDTNAYPTKVKVSDEELAAVNLQRDEFHGKWNYTIFPRQQKSG